MLLVIDLVIKYDIIYLFLGFAYTVVLPKLTSRVDAAEFLKTCKV